MEAHHASVLAIQVDNLHYQYPDGAKALCGASLHVAHGEAVGLVGPNGAGKTSLFACLAGVLRPDQGQVIVCGLNVAEPKQRRELPRKLGIVFQDSDDQLFHPSVQDEVAFGPLNLGLSEAEARQRVTTALTYVGLPGMETRVPYHLSGGEKKRVALASVLAMEPEVLLLDEPSSFLDPRGRRELIALVKQLPVAKLIASHDLEFIVATCQRVLLFDGGGVVAEGKLRDVLTDRQLMEKHGLEVPHSLTHPHPHATR